MHQWHHICLLKCSAYRHNPTGVAGTKEGKCVVLCPACPYVGINLPDDYSKARKNKAYVSWLCCPLDVH